MTAKKGSSVDPRVKQEDVIQAVIIADSFNSRFVPITHRKPRVLLPLVNRPLLEYTLDFLNNSGVDETFIFSCSHWQQIKQFVADYLISDPSRSRNSMTVQVIASETFQSMGDALRELDTKAIIKSDFILINGDSIGNLPIKEIRAQHKKNRQKDKGCVMTTVFRKAKPYHSIRSIEDELVTVVDSETNKILHFERVYHNRRLQIPLNKFQENQSVDIRHDLQDTHLSICSVNVPPLFADNFDYETRDHFIDGILVHEELLGNSIYAHVVDIGYCARVNNMSSYDTISKDILRRNTHPIVPDMISKTKYTYQRNNIYMQNDVHLEVDTKIVENVAIGSHSSLGSKTLISNSTVGSDCRIGDNVRIEDSYIWDKVVIEDNCVLTKCIVADGAHLMKNVVINPGSLISYDVILGPDIEVEKYSRIYFDPNEKNSNFDKSLVGTEGRGVLFVENKDSDDEQEEDDIIEEIWGESDEEGNDEDKYTTSTIFSDNLSDDERNDSPPVDDLRVFYDEVYDSLQRGIDEKVKCENLILEINSSKHAYNVPMNDLNKLVIKAILDLPDSDTSAGAYLDQLVPVLNHLLPLIQNYIKSRESQCDCITSIEEYCLLNPERMTPIVFVKLTNYLYDKEVLKEDIILEWYIKVSPLAEFDHREQQQLRSSKAVQGFIKWLEEAEEESSSDED